MEAHRARGEELAGSRRTIETLKRDVDILISEKVSGEGLRLCLCAACKGLAYMRGYAVVTDWGFRRTWPVEWRPCEGITRGSLRK